MESCRGIVAEIAASQWGLITTAQAEAYGVGRMLLSRMASAGELERVAHGIYVATSSAGEPNIEVRAHWIALAPGDLADLRLTSRHESGVVSHTSAAALHGIGDIPVGDIEFTLPERHRSRRPGARFHRKILSASEVTLVDGLPVTTSARTIADLLVDGHDTGHVADAVADILNRGLDTATHLANTLDPIAATQDAPSGEVLLHRLLTIVGMDPESVLERVRTHDLIPLAWTPTESQMEALRANATSVQSADLSRLLDTYATVQAAIPSSEAHSDNPAEGDFNN